MKGCKMPRDYLEVLAYDAKETVAEGYYNIRETQPRINRSLKEAILGCRVNPIIAEIKVASPSRGIIARDIDVEAAASMMRRGGAAALSILTEPKHFMGRIEYLPATWKVGLPRLMKDIIVDPVQVEAAAKAGAEAVLLITSIFQRNLSILPLEDMVSLAHKMGLEVLLETHTIEEFEAALKSQADLIGINNRDLSTMQIDLQVTVEIMSKYGSGSHIIVSESGIESPEHIRLLRRHGVKAFLVGSSIISSQNIEEKVRELAEA
ncbi:MAG: indole-3-glycerol-phosphate synthase [Candidatus Bathyarchaeia archaeon]